MIRRYRAVLPLAAAIGLIAAGCGSDSSGETTAPSVSIPAITAPVPTADAPATTAATTPGTTATNKGGKTFDPKAPDSETNDIPPANGSPEESFEKQCKQNPAACG